MLVGLSHCLRCFPEPNHRRIYGVVSPYRKQKSELQQIQLHFLQTDDTQIPSRVEMHANNFRITFKMTGGIQISREKIIHLDQFIAE